MIAFDEIRKIKEEQEKAWIKYESVTGIDIGDKFVNGSRIPNTAIRVFVNQKKPLIDISNDSELIPPTVIVDDKKPLFAIENFQGTLELDCSKFHSVKPTKLLDEFNKNRYYLSSNARIKTEKSDQQESDTVWHIIDDTAIQAYIVKKAQKTNTLRIYEAVRTDIIQREFIQFQTASAADTEDDDAKKIPIYNDSKLRGGYDADKGTGTLGVIVQERKPTNGERDLLFLTCYHVFKNLLKNDMEDDLSKTGEDPLLKRKYLRNPVGNDNRDYVVKNSVNQYFDKPTDKPEKTKMGLDCAVVKLNKPAIKQSEPPGSYGYSEFSSEIMKIGRIRGTAEAKKGTEVRKYGRATGLTYGIVDSVNLTVKVDDKIYYNQIGIVVDLTRNGKFGYNGDSGSVVVNNKLNAIGLLFARGTSVSENGSKAAQDGNINKTSTETDESSNMGGTYCAATPIQAVLDALNVDIYNEELEDSLDKDIDDSIKTIVMYPPPLSEEDPRFSLLYGYEICCPDYCIKCP